MVKIKGGIETGHGMKYTDARGGVWTYLSPAKVSHKVLNPQGRIEIVSEDRLKKEIMRIKE